MDSFLNNKDFSNDMYILPERSAVYANTIGDYMTYNHNSLNAHPVLVDYIRLNVNNLSISIGTNYMLKEIVLPVDADNKLVRWYSTCPEVAIVKNGLIYANSEGVATIFARATDGTNVQATCEVVVVS